MDVKETRLPGVRLVRPKLWKDHRGSFFELANQRTLEQAGFYDIWVQDNVSTSCAGTLRGMHYQLGNPQAKFVTCVAGEIIDVAVDIRKGSPTFGEAVAERLRGDEPSSLYIPEGFAHGFLVVSKSAVVIYKVTEFYSPADERGIAWRDSSVRRFWPEDLTPLLAPRDYQWPLLADAPEADLPSFLTS